MRTLRKKHPIILSIILVAAFLACDWGVSLAAEYLPYLQTLLPGDLGLSLMAEGLLFLLLVILTFALGMGRPFRPGRQGLGACVLTCLPLLLIYTFAMAAELIMISRQPLLPPLEIGIFVALMLLVGLTEELLFRGLITRMLYEKFGRTATGVWLSVLLSSLLFGTAHLGNAFIGQAPLAGVMVQAAVAASIGLCLGAIYLRSRSFWAVALLHGYLDFCGMISTGLFGLSQVEELIGGYTVYNLISVAVYGAMGLFLLRPSKMKTLTDPEAATPGGHVVMLMLTLLLLVAVVSAVAALLA